MFIISGKRLDDDQKTRGGLIGIGQDVRDDAYLASRDGAFRLAAIGGFIGDADAEHVIDGLRIVGEAAHQLAVGLAVKVTQRQQL